MIEPDDIFVGRPLAFRRRAPAALELGAIPYREYSIGVVGIDGEEHAASFTRPGRLHQRQCAGIPLHSRAIDFLRDLDRGSDRIGRATRGGPGSARRERLLPPPTRRREPVQSLPCASAYSTIGNARRTARASPLGLSRPTLLP